MQDLDIVTLLWARSEKALEVIDKQYKSYCLSIARSLLGNEEDAEECVNDTWLFAWNSIPPHKPENLAAYLGKITRRTAVDRYRKTHTAKRGNGEIGLILDELDECLADSLPDAEERLLQKELAHSINVFLSTLSSTERQIFLCRYWYGDSVKTLAARFPYRESGIKSLLRRTVQKLKIHLQKELDHEIS